MRGAPRKVDIATVRILYGHFRAHGLSNVRVIDLLATAYDVDKKTIRNALGDAEQRKGLASNISVRVRPWPRRKPPAD